MKNKSKECFYSLNGLNRIKKYSIMSKYNVCIRIKNSNFRYEFEENNECLKSNFKSLRFPVTYLKCIFLQGIIFISAKKLFWKSLSVGLSKTKTKAFQNRNLDFKAKILKRLDFKANALTLALKNFFFNSV